MGRNVLPLASAQRTGMRMVIAKLGGYACTAGAAAVVDLGGCAVLVVLGLPALLAATMSYGLALLVNYAATSRFVFRHPLSLRGLGRFAAASLVGLGVNLGVTGAALFIGHLPPVLAKALGIGVAFSVNFTMNVLVTFRRDQGSVTNDVQQ